MSLKVWCCGAAGLLGVLLALPRRAGRRPPLLPEAPGPGSIRLPVVSFNIRYDGKERDENNHFRHRAQRIARFVNETEPWLVGTQEALASQVLHLQGEDFLPKYKFIGYTGGGHDALPAEHPARHYDWSTGILYDPSRLELVESDHVWLSETPQVEDSKSWGSGSPRTLTIAAFRFRRQGGDEKHRQRQADLIHFNTHLDVWSAAARHGQARAMLMHILAWREKYPGAALVATGDFNSANGQEPHRILSKVLHDAWDTCLVDQERGACEVQPFAATFHGWRGTMVDRWAARPLLYILLAMHSSGMMLPRNTKAPESLREWRAAAGVLWQQLSDFGWLGGGGSAAADVWPASFTRIHVDWILFGQGRRSDRNVQLQPRAAYVGDVRDKDFSSDHFPVVTLFDASFDEP